MHFFCYFTRKLNEVCYLRWSESHHPHTNILFLSSCSPWTWTTTQHTDKASQIWFDYSTKSQQQLSLTLISHNQSSPHLQHSKLHPKKREIPPGELFFLGCDWSEHDFRSDSGSYMCMCTSTYSILCIFHVTSVSIKERIKWRSHVGGDISW